MTNAEFAVESEQFKKACELPEVKPTKRQASKFRKGCGSAYKALKESQNDN
jgi:hypothetical protein